MRYIALILLAAAAAMHSCAGCQTCGRSRQAPASNQAQAADQGLLGEEVRRAEADLGGAMIYGDSLRVTLGLREGGYALLEPVDFSLSVENLTNRTITLIFPTGLRYDFIVRKGKQVVWRWTDNIWSDDTLFGQVVSKEHLPAGETITYEVTWDQKGTQDIRPPLGAYSVQGILKTAPEMETQERTFGIVD